MMHLVDALVGALGVGDTLWWWQLVSNNAGVGDCTGLPQNELDAAVSTGQSTSL